MIRTIFQNNVRFFRPLTLQAHRMSSYETPIEEGIITINQVPTRIITLGGWITQPFEKNELIIIISGNPGLIGYYELFARALYHRLDGKYAVWGLGHAGHEVPPDTTIPTIKDDPNLFTLDGQLNHKIQFIDKYVIPGTKLHFIGHSIGAKICLDLVKKYHSSHDAKAYLLFPTLERMAETPAGRRLWPLIGPLRKPAVMLMSVIHAIIPESWLHKLVQYAMRSKGGHLAIEAAQLESTPPVHYSVTTTMKLLHPRALEGSLFMADDELKTVRELNVEDIKNLRDRLIFYFGTADHWCPIEYCHNLKRQVPNAKIVICPNGFEHAFVLKSSQEMASIVAKWMQSNGHIGEENA